MTLIGRSKERAELQSILSSKRAEFLVVYGRRRVGKTFLIKEFFSTKKVIFLQIIGSKDAPMNEQIQHFTEQVSLRFFNGVLQRSSKNWDEAFRLLTQAIKAAPQTEKVALFFDEFPWMVTKNSRLLQNLEYYWNQHWSDDPRVKLIICGSSASWIVNKIINNKGGLHNRITSRIFLEPFDLRETKAFLRHKGVKFNNRQVLDLYMTLGGVPYYLDEVKKGLSATQVIEQLAFEKGSFLSDEFHKLFASLFENSDLYIRIVRKITQNRYGMSQSELFESLGLAKGSTALSHLDSLEASGFIQKILPHARKKRGTYYRVVDEYTLFYLHWIEPAQEKVLKSGFRKGYWERMQLSPAWRSWSGYAFESVCYKHLFQIAEALHLSPASLPNAWRYSPTKSSTVDEGAQIDLLFDRDDGAITVCEIKHTLQPFKIDREYAAILQRKLDVFQAVTNTPKQLFLAMIVSSGLKESMYSEGMVDGGIVTLSDLFKKVE